MFVAKGDSLTIAASSITCIVTSVDNGLVRTSASCIVPVLSSALYVDSLKYTVVVVATIIMTKIYHVNIHKVVKNKLWI